MIKNSTAILIFSRTAQAEAEVKTLSVGKRSKEALAAFLIKRVHKVAAKSRLPVIFLSEKKQRGTTFGERLANAFDDVFAMGYERIISIGNDCLTLSASDILKAQKALNTTPSVLGTATDGGVYLIGLSKIVFKKEAFKNISWQTQHTCAEIVNFIKKQGFAPDFLTEKADLDSISDWKNALKNVDFLIKKHLLLLLNIGKQLHALDNFLIINSLFLKSSSALRAPPVLP